MPTFTGTIKTFGPQKGFGFIACDEVPGDGDVYFQASELPLPAKVAALGQGGRRLEGAKVSFELAYAPDGKPQGRGLQLVGPLSTTGSGDAGEFGHNELSGEVKSFSEVRGFGFLRCDALDSDVYFNRRDVPAGFPGQSIVGARVTFIPYTAPDGNLQARKLGLAEGQHQSMHQEYKSMQKQLQQMQKLVSVLAPGASTSIASTLGLTTAAGMDGQKHVGEVKCADSGKGYGFITSPSVTGDVYFKLEEEVMTGQKVAFVLRFTKDGKPQARHVKAAMVDGDIMVGNIKSYSDRNTYGFISADDASQDVYFQKKDLPDDLQDAKYQDLLGMAVRCSVKLQKDGRPHAQDIAFVSAPPQGVKRMGGDGSDSPVAKKQRLQLGGKPMSQMSSGSQVQGTVKSYKAENGWGFISSPSVPKDIYFKSNMMPSHLQSKITVGSPVVFTLNITPDGKPQAGDIMTMS